MWFTRRVCRHRRSTSGIRGSDSTSAPGGAAAELIANEFGTSTTLSSLAFTLQQIMAEQTGQALEDVIRATERDNFMSAEEGIQFGIVDQICTMR